MLQNRIPAYGSYDYEGSRGNRWVGLDYLSKDL